MQFLVGRAGLSFPLRGYATIARLESFFARRGARIFYRYALPLARFCSEERVWHDVVFLRKAAETLAAKYKFSSSTLSAFRRKILANYLRKQPNVEISAPGPYAPALTLNSVELVVCIPLQNICTRIIAWLLVESDALVLYAPGQPSLSD